MTDKSDTPRTDAVKDFTAPEKLYACSCALERELAAKDVELAEALAAYEGEKG